MNESAYGYLYDLSFDEGKDVIFVDVEELPIYLTKEDLQEMLEVLDG